MRPPARSGLALIVAAALVAMAGCGGGTPPKPGKATPRALIGGQVGIESGEGGGGRAARPHRAGRGGTGGATSLDGRSGVLGGTLFGGDVPLAMEEPSLGRNLAIVRDYYQLGERFPDAADAQLMARGSTLLVSLDTVPGGPTYAAIAAGRQDGIISTFLASVERAAVRYRLGAIYVVFEHEADTPSHHYGLGTPAEFVSAWDHIHQLAESMHLDWNQGGRLHWVWILTSQAFRIGVASAYWPGPNETDIVASDGYNASTCRSARPGSNMVSSGTQVDTPAALFGATLAFASTHGGLPVFIPEWGTIPYTSPSVQPAYIHQMQEYVAQNPAIAAVLYWDNHGHGNGCDYALNNHPASLQALASMGQASGLQGQVMPV